MSDAKLSDIFVLTGTIGSGKSTAAKLFQEFGATIVSADELARAAVEPGSDILPAIKAHFGANVITEDGSLNRSALRKIVFHDEAERKILERITHPKIQLLADQAFQEARKSGSLIIYDCPLYFEANLAARGFGPVIVVSCSDEIATERIMMRDGMTREEAISRVRQQLPISEKRERADYVLENSSTIDHLRSQIRELLPKLASDKS